MIKTQDLTKVYGDLHAIDTLNLELELRDSLSFCAEGLILSPRQAGGLLGRPLGLS